MDILNNFSKVKVLIIGDLMLDRYWWGNVSRISPEAPVPVVRLEKNTFAAGGAANVAVNVAGLGANACLIGLIGIDPEAQQFIETLRRAKVSTDFLVSSDKRPTTVKTRIIAHNQQVVRVDQEVNNVLTDEEEKRVWEKTNGMLGEIDIIIISDYAKGLLTDEILTRLIKTANAANKLIIIDPKGKNYAKYAEATLLTPNLREAAEACGLDENQSGLVEIAGSKLITDHALDALIITQGEDGMTLFQKNSKSVHLKASAKEIYDVTGAGDTVIATLAVAIAAGFDLEEAAAIANTAAGMVVEQVGTTAISVFELENQLKGI